MKNLKLWSLTLSLMLMITATAQTIDSKNSIVDFTVKKTSGTISGMKGEVILNTDDMSKSSFIVSVDPNTINTDNKKRDKHLKTEDFFDVKVCPLITFTSTSVSKTEDGYVTEGTMDLHGIIQKVKIIFRMESTVDGWRLSGNLTIDQLDYEMAKKESQVNIKINCLLKK